MTPAQVYSHCLDHGRNAELEKIILTDPRWAYLYARDVIKDKWIEAEDIVKTNPKYAYYYSLNVIKGRWKEAENVIAINPECAYLYAQNIIKGKLPENMHNAMLIHADNWSKEYLKIINKLTSSVYQHDTRTSIQPL